MAWLLLWFLSIRIAFPPWEAIEMSMIGSWSVASLSWAPPRGFGASLAALGPIATAFLKVRQFFEALKGTPRNGPIGGGPQEQPEECDFPAADSIWNDPAFWILLIH